MSAREPAGESMYRKPALLLATLSLASFILISGLACSASKSSPVAPKLGRPEATGKDLSNKFMTLLHNKDTAGLQTFLSDAFIIQRADGSSSAKTEYLTNLPVVNQYTVQDVQARQDGPVLTVKWDLEVDEVIDGKTYSGRPAPRLSTYVWHDSSWRMTSHANFNAPVADPTASR